jgi:predicted enzyme related to lactoylglutathione lyase
MPVFTAHAPGSPCWVDLSSPDVDASKAFYSALFGWDALDQYAGDERVYTLFSLGGKVVAGLGGQAPGMEGMAPMWNTYIAVADCEATAAAVTAAGGTVIAPPMQVMSAGEMAVFADPTGAVFSIWRAGDHIGAELCNEANTYSWNELMDRDVERAKTFYHEVFGWEYDEQDMGPMGTYSVIAGGDNGGLGGLMAMPPDLPPMVPNHWVVYFTVADLEASIEKAAALGGQTVHGPMAIAGVGVMATLHDPAGGSFALLEGESA